MEREGIVDASVVMEGDLVRYWHGFGNDRRRRGGEEEVTTLRGGRM